MDLLRRFRDVCEDPFSALKGLKDSKKVIGVTPSDVPDEVIHAAGLHPFMILGTTAPIKYVTALIPDNACSLARSNLELVLAYQREFFDGFVIPQVDDTTQHISDLWERRFRHRFFHKFLTPRQLSRPSARLWFRKEVERLMRALEDFAGIKITDESLWRSIRLFNEDRRELQRLYDLKRRVPGIISNRDFFDIVKASLMMDRREHLEALRAFLQGIKEGGRKDLVPIALAGITVEPPEIFDFLDEFGFNVVSDNLVTGSRHIYSVVPEEADPIEALLKRHFSRPNFSPIHDSPERVVDDLLELVRDSGAKGLIYIHIQYCESQDFDLPDIRRRFREEGIPLLVLTTEYQTRHIGLMRTRIEAFRELIDRDGGR